VVLHRGFLNSVPIVLESSTVSNASARPMRRNPQELNAYACVANGLDKDHRDFRRGLRAPQAVEAPRRELLKADKAQISKKAVRHRREQGIEHGRLDARQGTTLRGRADNIAEVVAEARLDGQGPEKVQGKALSREGVETSAGPQAALARLGRQIWIHDVYIAATGIRRGPTIVTGNKSHFERVPKLKVEGY
jgi:hypothetical protein